MKMKWNVGVWLAVGCVLLTAMAAGAGGGKENAPKGHPQMLFVQTCTGGSLENGVLSLTGFSPMTLFFSDRPERMTGHLLTEDFLAVWHKGRESFDRVPPNAVLSVYDAASGRMVSAVLELTSPRAGKNGIAYQAKVLEGTPPRSFGAASLFIDGDQVAETNTRVIGEAPAMAMGDLYRSIGAEVAARAAAAAAAAQAGNAAQGTEGPLHGSVVFRK